MPCIVHYNLWFSNHIDQYFYIDLLKLPGQDIRLNSAYKGKVTSFNRRTPITATGKTIFGVPTSKDGLLGSWLMSNVFLHPDYNKHAYEECNYNFFILELFHLYNN